MTNTELVINKGDTVVIKAQGIQVRGKVLSAAYYGGRDGWYIELIEANVPGGYSYWKQGLDGGSIIEVNGVVVIREKQYRRILSHLICESLGYLTPESAKRWIEEYKSGDEFYCEWVIEMLSRGALNPTKSVLEMAIKNRHYHHGCMNDYRRARRLVDRYYDQGVSPQFASWF